MQAGRTTGKLIRIVLLFAGFIFLVTQTGWAVAEDSGKEMNDSLLDQERESVDTGDSPLTGSQSYDFFSLFIKMLVILLFIIVLIYALIRFLSFRKRPFHQGNLLSHLGGISLGANKSVQLVQVGRSLYLLGVGEDVRLIQQIENQDEIDELLSMVKKQHQSAFQISWPSWLKEKLEKMQMIHQKKRENEQDINQDSFQSMLQQKLSEVKSNREKARQTYLQSQQDEERDNQS
ncbi:MAG: flagellar biosynthetic protein FliO [Bacillaceae bacterium]|nr:flagellar biosynthetic protein FliO [Bacillaceae bacterium]